MNLRITLPFILLFFCFNASFGQYAKLTIQSEGPTPQAFLELMSDDKAISDDDVMNERIIDLVDVYVVDSVLTKKTQRHRVFGSPLIELLGYKWKSINMRKEKFVGTSKNEVRIPGKARLKEYDINFDLTPHLKSYIDLAYEGYKTQKEIGRAKKKKNYEVPPFVYPKAKTNLNKYSLHCECTPHAAMVPMLNQAFYPTIRGSNLKTHANFMDPLTTIGLYGAFVSDCNHKCHPEIHPYEWIWWLNLNQELKRRPNQKIWMIGMIRDVSERMRNWVPAPRTGEISIPFIFPLDSTLDIEVEHLAFNQFDHKTLASQVTLPPNASTFNFTGARVYEFDDTSLGASQIQVSCNYPIRSQGLTYWISSLHLDKEKGLISGKFHIALSVEDLYTTRVFVGY